MTDLQISVGDTIRDNDVRHAKPGADFRTGKVREVQPGHVVVDWDTGKRTSIIRASIFADDKPRKGKYSLVGKTGVAA